MVIIFHVAEALGHLQPGAVAAADSQVYACGRNGSQPLARPDLARFLPWNASLGDLHAQAQPPRPG
ncbi:MAG: hypothetical protein M3Y33_03495 [Actinomycetota bacterium]|nr:hypothetical protein [Actinomycetota bacterium]